MEGIIAERWNLPELKEIPTEKVRRWSEGKPEQSVQYADERSGRNWNFNGGRSRWLR